MLQWLEDSYLAVSIRQSLYLYPALEIMHITGIVLLVGPALLFDFRILGLSRIIPVSALSNYLLPWSKRSLFVLIIPSGILLFSTNAVALAADSLFWIKMSLLLLALSNAFIFHWFVDRHVAAWNTTTNIPFRVKITATLSILLWLMIIACGRLLAY